MRVDQPVNGLRQSQEKPMRTWVVIGDGDRAGQTKTVYFHSNMTSPLVTTEWRRHGGRAVRLLEIDVASDYKARGWRLLQELYTEEGMETEWEHWLDYQKACTEGRADVDFPVDLLPQAVRKMRSTARQRPHMWRPPSGSQKT